ncbi:MAG TPA: hypothetical protein DDW78_07325 [Treponema sp.]|nr:hypothetical protein [Treponema sp.]
MTFASRNPWMTAAAAEIPDGIPAVLFMRHEERYGNPPDGDYSKLLLTPEGVRSANATGASIDRKLGVLRSSCVGRCKQTLQEIVRSVPAPFAPDGQIAECREFSELLGDPRPKEEGGIGWYEYYNYLQLHDAAATRGVTLEAEAGRILDALFRETAGSRGLSIACSHDGHVVILASALFGLRTGTTWSEEWCHYAEGLFFYGERDDFTALWRGQKKRFRGGL